MTKVLSWQNYVCCDKIMFVATKMILVAAPANGKIWVTLPGCSYSSHKSSAKHYHHCTSVCCISMCPKNSMAASIWDFWHVHRCWYMLLDVGAVQILKRVHWQLTLGLVDKKIPYHTMWLNPCQYCARLFSLMLYWLSYPSLPILLELVIRFQQNLVPALLPISSASELSLKIEYVHLNWLNGW